MRVVRVVPVAAPVAPVAAAVVSAAVPVAAAAVVSAAVPVAAAVPEPAVVSAVVPVAAQAPVPVADSGRVVPVVAEVGDPVVPGRVVERQRLRLPVPGLQVEPLEAALACRVLGGPQQGDRIIALANSLGMDTIAEGVETEEESALLASNGCYQMQGYHFSRPLPQDMFKRWLMDWEKG